MMSEEIEVIAIDDALGLFKGEMPGGRTGWFPRSMVEVEGGVCFFSFPPLFFLPPFHKDHSLRLFLSLPLTSYIMILKIKNSNFPAP